MERRILQQYAFRNIEEYTYKQTSKQTERKMYTERQTERQT